jgi:hypothetical protein
LQLKEVVAIFKTIKKTDSTIETTHTDIEAILAATTSTMAAVANTESKLNEVLRSKVADNQSVREPSAVGFSSKLSPAASLTLLKASVCLHDILCLQRFVKSVMFTYDATAESTHLPDDFPMIAVLLFSPTSALGRDPPTSPTDRLEEVSLSWDSCIRLACQEIFTSVYRDFWPDIAAFCNHPATWQASHPLTDAAAILAGAVRNTLTSAHRDARAVLSSGLGCVGSCAAEAGEQNV